MVEHYTSECTNSEVRRTLMYYEKEGWELVAAVTTHPGGFAEASIRLFFKRNKPNKEAK